MKKLGGLKGFNAKEFLLDHAEKLALGLFGLIVLGVLFKTDWSRTDKSPQAIKAKVTDAENRIRESVWPAEKKAAFQLKDFAGDAQRVRGPLDVTAYEYSTNMWWPLYRKQELAKEPVLLAVLDLQAKAGLVAIPTSPQPAGGDLLAADDGVNAANPAAAAPPADPNDPFAPRTPVRNPFGGADGEVFGAPTGPIAGGPAMRGGGAAAGIFEDGGYGGEMGMGMGSNLEARGERFIAVRGVWPLWQQLENIQRAMNLQTTNDARAYLDLLDFVLERQMAMAGDDPWAGPWEVVDIQRAFEVLDECVNYDIERVDPQILHPVITMPMPERKVGYWGDYATHPRIERFRLPPAELEREIKLQEKLRDEYEKYEQELKKRTTARGGFDKRSVNTRGMAEMLYENTEVATEWEQSMRGTMERDPTMRMQLPDLKSRLTAVGRLLLFRYLDFDVRPGYAYRYRVKLKLRNPNFERPLDQVLTESVAQGIDRETPWSEPSNPAVIRQSVNYFLDDVERDPVTEPRPIANRSLAKVDFFEWDAKVGTMIRDTIDVRSFGQFLGGTRKSLRLDVVKETFKDDDVTFHSDDLLVDALMDLRLDPSKVDANMHAGLTLPPSSQRGKVGLQPEALVVTSTGEIKTLDKSPTSLAQRDSLADYVRRERAPWEEFKNIDKQKPLGLMEGEIPGVYADDMAAEMTEEGMGRRKSRKPRASRSMVD